MTLRDIQSPIDGHPNPQLGFPFFDAATGSLGQGLSVAAGLGAACPAGRVRAEHLLHYRRWRGPRGADLGSGRLPRRSPAHQRRPHLQLQRTGPERLGLPPAVGRHSGPQAWRLWLYRPRDRRPRSRSALPAPWANCPSSRTAPRPLAIVARTIKGWGASDEYGMGKHGTPRQEGQAQCRPGGTRQNRQRPERRPRLGHHRSQDHSPLRRTFGCAPGHPHQHRLV